MPETTPPEPETPDKSSGGPMRLITAAMVSAALITTGYLIGGRGGGTAAAPPEATEQVAEEEEPEVGHVIDLDAVNVNLLEGHYLRIAVSLGISEEVELHDPEEFASAPASDLVVSTFSGKSVKDLSSLEGRLEARMELEEGLHHYYGEEIVAVFFTEFVMQ